MLMAVLWPRALSLMSRISVADCVLPISRIMVGQGLPKIGCASTSAAVIEFRGSGRGFGRKLASGCFFLPGIQTSITSAHNSEESLGDVTLCTFSFKDGVER